MIERSVISEQPGVPNGETPADQPENRPPALELRVRRLEDAVATLQDTRPLEERIVERVSRRLNRDSAPGIQEPGGVFRAGRQLLPAALDLIRNQSEDTSAGDLRRPWLLFDAYAELRTMVRMYLDPRYRPTWAARIVPLALLVLIMTSWFWLPVPSILGASLIDKTVDIALAFLAFKILHREARRYRELVTDLPALPRS